jgi:hypothetical protein
VADVCSGAVREFAGEEAIVDYGKPDSVLARLVALRAVRPTVTLPAGYDAETVVTAWRSLLANLGQN